MSLENPSEEEILEQLVTLDGLTLKELIFEFISNQPTRKIFEVFEKTRKDARQIGKSFLTHELIKRWTEQRMEEEIKSLKPGKIYESGLRYLLGSRVSFSDERCRIQIPDSKKELWPDLYLLNDFYKIKKGFLEVRGFSHYETGTADEKNAYLERKYDDVDLDEDEYVSVILCGKITEKDEKFLEETQAFHDYLEGRPVSLKHKRLAKCWKIYKFNGYYTFDEIYSQIQAEQESTVDILCQNMKVLFKVHTQI